MTWLALLLVASLASLGNAGIMQKSFFTLHNIKDRGTYVEMMKRYGKRDVMLTGPRDSNEKIWAQFGTSLQSVLNWDRKNQIIKLHLWNQVIWKDGVLGWHRGKGHAKVVPESILVPVASVWKPDIYCFTAIQELVTSPGVSVYHDGKMVWTPKVLATLPCLSTINNGFENVTCAFEYGSWMRSGNDMDITPIEKKPAIEITNYKGSWDVRSAMGARWIRFYKDSPNIPYPSISYVIQLSRKGPHISVTSSHPHRCLH